MRAGSEGGVGDDPLKVVLTSTRARVFSDLNPAAQIPSSSPTCTATSWIRPAVAKRC